MLGHAIAARGAAASFVLLCPLAFGACGGDGGTPVVPSGPGGACPPALLWCSTEGCCPPSQPFLCLVSDVCQADESSCPTLVDSTNVTRCLQQACTSDAQCGGATPFCAVTACVQCTQDSQCSGATPFCSGADGTCVECAIDDQCGGATPICDATSRKCVPCGQGQCPDPTPICAASGSCVECSDDTQCAPSLHCDTTQGACVP